MNFNLIKDNILALKNKNNNALAVMGGAYWAAQVIHTDTPDFYAFVTYLSGMVQAYKHFGWHEPLPKAMRTFCHLAMVAPALVEAYLGMRFEEVA